MRRMLRAAILCAFVLVAVSLTAPRAASEVLSRFHAHGAHAAIIWEDGLIFGIVSVSQDGRAASRAQTFLFYEIFVEGEPVEAGFGFIRNVDVRGGTGGLTLSTDTTPAANPAFNRAAGTGGVLNIVWQRNPSGFASGGSGTSWVRFGEFTARTTGNSVFHEALATGGVTGFEIGGIIIESHVGRHNNATIEIIRGK